MATPSPPGGSCRADTFEQDTLSHLDAMYSVAYRLTRNPNLAEDLVQDAVVKAIRSRDQFQPGTNMKAWLLRIVTTTFLNHYKRGGLERDILDGPDADPLTDGWMSASTMRAMRDAESIALQPILQEELQAALDALPEEFRLAVVLSDIEEMSYKEIADLMGCPIGTVMSRLHRGRKLLKSALHAHAVDMGIVDESAEAEPTNLDEYRAKRRFAAR